MTQGTTAPPKRLYPMNKRDGFVPAVQRYSAEHPEDVSAVSIVYLGMQSSAIDPGARTEFIEQINGLFGGEHGPILFDFAHFMDPAHYDTLFAVAYWYDPEAARQWAGSSAVNQWWTDPTKDAGTVGYFREAFTASVDHTETILFKEFVRGLSACPMTRIKAMGESGYWGAARDRISASAHDRLDTPHAAPLQQATDRQSTGRRLRVSAPANLVLIRSGVSWTDCGEEQLNSYLENLKPLLDEGMEHLRQNPVDTGCCCMRQVDSLDKQGETVTENFCAGYFQSLQHLESWAKEHPTHLAIFGRAQNERTKYQERLELRTYHEVFVIDRESTFDYINCHPQTGLLPWFEIGESA